MPLRLLHQHNNGLHEEAQTSSPSQEVHDRRSLPSHLLWRSALGAPAAWSGSSSRGVYLPDSADNGNNGNEGSMIQNIASDKRMFHLPISLRDAIVGNELSCLKSSNPHSTMQLLSHPRIVGAAPPRSTFYSAGRAFSGTSDGISCMDLDRGNDGTNHSAGGSPPRYLLVGSGGGDCSIALYDLSYFGSDQYLYQQSSSSNISSTMNSQYLHHQLKSNQQSHQSSVTHRPIARSLRHTNAPSPEENASGVPSGHRQPLLGVNWYPGDVYGSFVSASISGEILVWDAQNFVPVFATYTHIYTGAARNEEEGNKSVAPLQCMDLPKTPEGCPHGNALLALGLGADGRGVIQLCDAFRGGSATHELIGHGTGGTGGGGGGVNVVAWDPHHPFRLASGGDDCAVRLWDIRKAGAAACLGVLNQDNEMNSSVTNDDSWMLPSRKKQRAGLSTSMSRMHGIESHGGPVTALAFAPGGDDLVSTGLDGKTFHWDLRPDSCFVSSVAAISDNKRSSVERGGGGMDPSVAIGGRLMPTHFAGHGSGKNKVAGGASKSPSQRRPSSRRNKASLAIIQPGSRSTATLLSTANNIGNSSKGQITGYSLYGRRDKEPGGEPDFILSGHLADVTCLVTVDGVWDNLKVGSCDDSTTTSNVKFLTGGKDGMVLSWGSNGNRFCRHLSGDAIDGEDYGHSRDGSSHQCQSRFRGGNDSVFNRSQSIQEEPSFEDMDSW